MAKETGLGANFYIDGVDLSGDVGSMRRISKGITTLPMTGIDKFAMERKAALMSAGIDWSCWFNPSAGQQHANLKNVPRTDRIASYVHKAAVLGTPVAAMVCKQVNYAPKRGEDGSLVMDVDTMSNAYWLDWGYALTTGKRTDTGATNGTGVDFGAAFNFGLQAYLHVFAFTGTSVTVKLQQSSDNGVGDAFSDVTGGGFTVVTAAPASQRIATARNQAVERYLRVVTTGTFSNAVFAVSATVNRTEMTI